MNEKARRYGRCPDCGKILLPKPKCIRDGCLMRPLFCQKCRAEKFVTDIVVLYRQDGDSAGLVARR